MKIPLIAVGILTAGAMLAQTAQTPPSAAQVPSNSAPNASQGQAGNHHRVAGNWQDQMVQRMTARLSLTPDQQVRVKAILKDSREHNKGVAAKVREERMALHNAVKTDSEGQIDQIIQSNSQVNSQVEANHVKTMAKIYAILTPAQKAKFDQRFDRTKGGHREKNA